MATDLPQIPGYFALRVGADLASAVRGQTIFLNYAPGTLEVTEPDVPDSVPVFTDPSASNRPLPLVTSATLTVDGYGSLTLDGNLYSALFWSESAVEKFLLPYYASAGGPHAYQVLHAINKAWYNYEECIPVCALAFAYPSEPLVEPNSLVGSMQLWDTVSVICCQPGQPGQPIPNVQPGPLGYLAVAPLLTFLQSLPTPQLTEIPSTAQGSGSSPATVSTEPTLIDSISAREVAEYVSGLRGSRVLVYGVATPGGLEPTLTPIDTDGSQLLFDAFSPYVRNDRPTVSVELDVEGTIKQLAGIGGGQSNVPDSVFWTDGAVDMLLLPYYASVEGHLAPWYLMLLLGKWAGLISPGVVDAEKLLVQVVELLGRVLLETPGGRLGAIERRLEGEGETGLFASDVYAIIHLPNSEWVDQVDPSLVTIWLENRTWLLSADGDFPLVSPRRRLVPRRRVTA